MPRNANIEKIWNLRWKIYNILCFAIPIVVFIFMFFPYILFGENCVITIHDNLDSNIPWAKYERENHYYFSLNTPSSVMNNLPVIYFGGLSFHFRHIINCVFPPFLAYTINFVVATLLGFFSMYYLQKLIFGEKYRLTIILTSLMFSCLPCFPGFRLDISVIPCAAFLFFHVVKYTKKNLWLLAFFYPFLSSFVGTGLFVCGLWLLGFIIVSVCNRKIHWQLFFSFLLLCLGTVLVNFRLFYMRLMLHEPLNRDFFSVASVNFYDSFKNFIMYGYYHASSLQRKIILPFSILTAFCGFSILFADCDFSIKALYKRIPQELKILITCFILIFVFSFIASLQEAGFISKILKVICPPLAGFSFARFFMFNCVLWYIVFSCSAIYCYKEKFSRIFAVICMLAQLALICGSTDFYADSAKSWKKNIVGSKSISWREFYSEDLFQEIKEAIDYKGEAVCAFGYHPSVLMYNKFNCIDGYISVYPYKDMVLWHNLMAPEFEHNEGARIYFDGWGGRRYIYSDKLSYEPTVEKEHDPVNFDVDMNILRNEYGCRYVLSRAEIANASKQGLQLRGIFDSNESLYRIFVYEL